MIGDLAERTDFEGLVARLWSAALAKPVDETDVRRVGIPRVRGAPLGLDRLQLVESARPWLAPYTLAASQVLSSRTVDGWTIESYLTLPNGDGPHPLVVMPHGGPIGIRNLRQFDPEVQLIASLGYAVLQVNFRGSAGFGRAFREAGHAQLGALIESDIDIALNDALRNHPLDAARICAIALCGSSTAAVCAIGPATR